MKTIVLFEEIDTSLMCFCPEGFYEADYAF